MLDDLAHAERLSVDFGIPVEDVLLIALNAAGLSSSTDTSRMRLRLRLDRRPDEEFRFILSTKRKLSPFAVDGDGLYLNSERIASVRELQDDTAVIGYFRRNGTVITLNSNSRSHCTGCAFCPNTLAGAADVRQTTEDELTTSLRVLADHYNCDDLSHVVEVNLSTGCFGDEASALRHLKVVKSSLEKLNCKGQIGLLSSVLRSETVFSQIADLVGPIQLVLTAECFGNRSTILKASKSSLTPDDMPSLLSRARAHGHDTNMTYIVGLDEPALALKYFEMVKPYLTRFPNLQVYQPHNPLMDAFCASSAFALEFYLDMRRSFERLFSDTKLRPLSWANYRPLWYFEFAGMPLQSIRA